LGDGSETPLRRTVLIVVDWNCLEMAYRPTRSASMPVTLTYPGVYIEEVPSGVRTIVGVSTSTTAFLGRAARGPVDDPVTIHNFGDFERVFGGLRIGYPMSYAVRDFFLNGGTQAVIVRIYSEPDGNASARIDANGLDLEA